MTLFTKERESGAARQDCGDAKIGGAVERNRAKRVVREVFRHHKPSGAIDIVVIPRREMLDASYERVEAEFQSLLQRSPKRVNA